MSDNETEQQAPSSGGGDWTAFLDDTSGQTYYYNETTGESRWDAPPGFDDDGGGDVSAAAVNTDNNDSQEAQDNDNDGITNSPQFNVGDDNEDDDDDADDDGITRSPPMYNEDQSAIEGATGEDKEAEQQEEQQQQQQVEEEEAAVVADGEEIGGGWIAYHDAEGRVYYANSETGETQWEIPTVVVADGDVSKQSDDGEEGATASQDEEGQPIDDTEDEPTMDAAAVAEQFLQGQDAIMEDSVLEHIATLISELGNVAGKKALQYLVQGYQGDTAMCGLMGLWLAELKSSRAAASSSSSGKPRPTIARSTTTDVRDNTVFQEGAADAARDVVESVINRLARERFTTNGGDAIMKLTKKQAAFVDEMIKSDRWRKMLIDLSASNKDSKLFMYCLQTISNLGHHREIANRIDQSDYFGVFNSLLRSELSVAGKLAVAGYDGYKADGKSNESLTSGQIETLTSDLRRTCTATSYTYLYAMVVLQELIKDAKDSNNESLRKACQKWERLKEELEEEMMKPVSTGTTFQRKRRIDVALAMSDLVQRQRRRIDPTSDEAGNRSPVPSNIASKNNLADALDSAIVVMLTKSSLGNQVDKDMAENILKFAYGGSTERIGDLLIKHPFTITTLLHNLFGTKRIRQLETRLKCARLIALAVAASERAARSQQEGITVSNEDSLSQIVLKGSQLCEQVENMVSFTAIDSVEEGQETSAGRQLSAMCIKYPVIAQGALIWAKELASNPDFVTTAAYPTLAPCILCLVRIISLHHPLARPAALELSLIFIGHSNSDISHQKMESIKEQCLRLMLLLSAQGLCIEVISAVKDKLRKNGSSELDSALIRYFVSGLLDTVQTPLTAPFCNSFCELLVERQCVDALKSQHFENGRRAQIIQLINQVETDGKRIDERFWTNVRPMLTAVKSVYSAGEVLN
mmetsp:Transcript_1482/g.3059  ORF Transcript_1482/g.3059 Transcript_1482/m.3059 type:complete len:922 (+) Transcript_1482:164-2929(+)